MSGKAVGWAMEQRTGSPTMKLVLLKLADNANEWKAWPSVQLIAEDTELSERAVREHLRNLESLGLIRAQKRFEDGVQLPTMYQLVADNWVPRKAGERIPKLKKGGALCAPPVHAGAAGHNMQPDGAESAPPVGHDVPPNPYDKPLEEPLLSAPAVAVESENVASLGKGAPERFPEFRSVVAKTWPGGFPADNEIAARKAWDKLTRTNSPDLILKCAVLHGVAKTEAQKRRAKDGTHQHMRLPSNWLSCGDWEGYSPQAEAATAREGEKAFALGRVRRAIGDGLFGMLRERMSDDAVAMLDGMTLEGAATLAITRPVQRTLLEKHTSALERHLGEPPTFTLVSERKAS